MTEEELADNEDVQELAEFLQEQAANRSIGACHYSRDQEGKRSRYVQRQR
jgi:hypothetical protein